MTRPLLLVVCVIACADTMRVSAQSAGRQIRSSGQVVAMPPRDTSAARDRPAIGSGTITERESGRPMRDVVVTAHPSRAGAILSFQPTSAPTAVQPISIRTDDDGRFTLTRVPAGEYFLSARRHAWVDPAFAQSTPAGPPHRVVVADGLEVGPLEFALARGGVIAGRVVDEFGGPLERALVRPIRLRRMGKHVRLQGAGEAVHTDDRGEFRLFGLMPAEYVVSVEPPRSPRFGDTRADDGDQQGTATTYAPGTANPAEARAVSLAAGEELDLSVHMVSVRVVSVSGRVEDSRGVPLGNGPVRLQPADSTIDLAGTNGPLARDGTFVLHDVPPGRYVLIAQQYPAPETRVHGPAPPPEIGVHDVSIDGQPVAGLAIRTSSGTTVRGRVIVAGGAALPAARDMRVSALPLVRRVPMPGAPPTPVQPDGSFELRGLRSRMLLRLSNLPTGWWIRDIRVGGSEAGGGFEFGDGGVAEDVVIVVDPRTTMLRGTVVGVTARPAVDASIVIFPEDERRWMAGLPAHMAVVRVGIDGRFDAHGMAPGRYCVIALPPGDVDPGMLGNAEALRELRARARVVAIEAGQPATVDLGLATF